jgi:tetratricopeptide (TPR) repeat protein
MGDAVTAPEQGFPLPSEQEGKGGDPGQPAEPQCILQQSENGLNTNVTKPDVPERGVDMKESDLVFDFKTPAEWNELGNKFLRAGSYNDAINAFTKAIELAPDLSWPYIRNLASAHYHKGKIKGKRSNGKPEEPDVWEAEDDDVEPIVYFNQENIPAAKRGDDFGDPERDQKASTVVTPTDEKGTSPVQGRPSAENPTLLTPSNSGMQSATNSTTGAPAGKQLREHQDQVMDSGELTPIPPGFLPIPKVEGTGPQSAFDWNVLGNSYASTQDYDKAINAYKKSIEMDPCFGQAYCNLGCILYQSGKYESAVLILKKSLDYMLTPEEKSLAWNRLGDVYRRLRDYGNAMAAYQKAGQSNPDTNPVLTRSRLSLMDPIAVG